MSNKNQSAEQAITELVYGKKEPTYFCNGYSGSFDDVCKHFGVIPQTVRYRMKYRGMSLEEALTVPLAQQGRDHKSSEVE